MWTRQVRLFRFILEVFESDRTASVQEVTPQGQLHWENAIHHHHHRMCESAVVGGWVGGVLRRGSRRSPEATSCLKIITPTG